MTEHYDTLTLLAIVDEARKHGFPDSDIAARLELDLTDPVFQPEGDLDDLPLGNKLYGIGKNFRERQFARLPEDDKHRLMIIMARISESSFRRGLQHGEYFTRNNRKLWITPQKLRFDVSLDKAPCADDKGYKPTALERLSMEHGDTLRELGFGFIDNPVQ